MKINFKKGGAPPYRGHQRYVERLQRHSETASGAVRERARTPEHRQAQALTLALAMAHVDFGGEPAGFTSKTHPGRDNTCDLPDGSARPPFAAAQVAAQAGISATPLPMPPHHLQHYQLPPRAPSPPRPRHFVHHATHHPPPARLPRSRAHPHPTSVTSRGEGGWEMNTVMLF